MKKRTTSLLLCCTIIISMFYCLAGIPVAAATIDTLAVSATQSQTNISLRADAMYGSKWTAKATCTGWRGNYTFTKGNEYRIPYGQPVNSGKYVGFSISVPDFLSATTSSSNIFYTSKSEYSGATSTYYANDCSAFVSYCWGISRNTTSSLGNLSSVTSYGYCNTSNVDKLKLGDALNCSGSHVVLVSGITYTSSGAVDTVEITEQTPPQLKRTSYSRSALASKYGSSYKILRYTGSVSAPTFTVKYDANGGSGSMSNQTIKYAVSTTLSPNTFTKSGYTFKGWNAYRNTTKLWYYTDGTSSGWYEKGSQPSGYSLKLYKDENSVSKTGYGVGDSVTMYAVWEKASDPTFTFKFMPNGGTGTMADQTINYGTDTAISANEFTRDGYTFKGWYAYRADDSTWRYTDGTNTTWCAKGEQPAGYYRFVYSDGAVVAKTGKGTGDTVKLYAVWAGATYKVKYNANGGTGTMSNSTHINGVEKPLTANAFTKSGNSFGGWLLSRKSDGKVRYYKDSDNSAWYVPGEQPDGYKLQIYPDQKLVSALSNVADDVVTLKAYWIPNTTGTTTFYIDFNGNGGTGSMDRLSVVKGNATPLPKCTFVKPGYKFKAWRAYRSSDDKWRYKDADNNAKWALFGEQPAEYTVTATYPDEASVHSVSSVDCDVITFFAEWEEDFKFTFTFDANGGEGTMPDQLVTYGVNTTISKNTFTKPGYKFAGWNAYRLADGTARYTNGTTAGFYTVGEQPDGYDSLYVYKDEQTVAKTGLGLDDTVLLKAVWEEDFKFTFTFDANGGEGTMPDQLVVYGESTPINSNQFTKTGYKFVGWNAYRQSVDTWRYKNGSDSIWCKQGEQPEGYELAVYKDGASVSKTGTGLDDIVIMYAVWEYDMKFTLSFDANGGEGTMPDQLVIYGESTNINKNTFTKQGCNFVGWNVYRTADDTWRYTDGTNKGWYKEGEQPEGYTLSVYKDEASVAKTGLGTNDTVKMIAVWEEAPVIGDANGDGKVSIVDATLIQKHLAEIETLSEESLALCDTNKDGVVNIKDVTMIQKYIAALITSFD